VQPIGDQRCGTDLAADPDAVPGDQLVAGKPHDRRDRDSNQVRYPLRVHQPVTAS